MLTSLIFERIATWHHEESFSDVQYPCNYVCIDLIVSSQITTCLLVEFLSFGVVFITKCNVNAILVVKNFITIVVIANIFAIFCVFFTQGENPAFICAWLYPD